MESNILVIGIAGGSASGKSTLRGALAKGLDATLVHMDDFFLPMELRTPKRFAQPGGNVHWERVLAEVLQPLREGKSLEYGVFNCSVMAAASPQNSLEVMPRFFMKSYSCISVVQSVLSKS